MKPKTKAESKKKPAGVVKTGAAVASKTKPEALVSFPVKADPKEQASAEATAEFAMLPSVSAAMTLQTFATGLGKLDIGSLTVGLNKSISKVQGGDLKECEAMLMGQAHSLQSIFQSLAARAAMNLGHYPNAVDSYMRLALRAQSQCRATLETLATIKNPPVLFAKQANIANGPQQVNNGTPAPGPAHGGKVETIQNELMEAQDAERLDR